MRAINGFKILGMMLLIHLVLAVPAQAQFNISRSAENNSEIPRVAINDLGDIMVIWHEHILGPDSTYHALKKYNEDWSRSTAIPNQNNRSSQHCDIFAMGDDFVVAWFNKKSDRVEFTRYSTADETWSEPEVVNNVHEWSFVKIIATTDNRIAVGWMEEVTQFDILVKIWDEEEGWGDVKNVSAGKGTSSKYHDMYPGPDGEIYVSWQQKFRLAGAGNNTKEIVVNIEDGNGNWDGPEEINGINLKCYRPAVAVNLYGTYMVGYMRLDTTKYIVSIMRDGQEDDRTQICTADFFDHDQYMTDAVSYGAGFIFICKTATKEIVYTTWDENDPEWTPITALGKGVKPAIDISGQTGAVAVWEKYVEGRTQVYGRIFDIGSGIFSPLNQNFELVENEGIFKDAYFYRVTWEKNSKNSGVSVNKYNIYRRAAGEVFEKIADVDSNTYEYNDYSLGAQALKYYYYVTAESSGGEESIIIQ